jgi:hypothetical protein
MMHIYKGIMPFVIAAADWAGDPGAIPGPDHLAAGACFSALSMIQFS